MQSEQMLLHVSMFSKYLSPLIGNSLLSQEKLYEHLNLLIKKSSRCLDLDG